MLTGDGGVIDDIIVRWLAADRIVVLPNGVNLMQCDLFSRPPGGDIVVTDLRPRRLCSPCRVPEHQHSSNRPSASPQTVSGDRSTADLAAGTGYTGVRGRMVIPADQAGAVFDDLLNAGAVPCGLGARDTLRLEMGFPLWGQDLDTTTSPLEAGLEWVVGWDHEFVGKDALPRVSAPQERHAH